MIYCSTPCSLEMLVRAARISWLDREVHPKFSCAKHGAEVVLAEVLSEIRMAGKRRKNICKKFNKVVDGRFEPDIVVALLVATAAEKV
jgi:hypothetical protein